MPRRILTKTDIDELLDSGATELRLAPGDIVTALAREYAQERGLTLAQDKDAPAAAKPAAQAASKPEADAPTTGAAVRKAVVAALGYEPDGLDAAISKALK